MCVQSQGKLKAALGLLEGHQGDVIAMAAERRTLRASLHVRFFILHSHQQCLSVTP